MLLLVAAGGTYILENPMNSMVALHPRFIWLCERLLEHGIIVPQPVSSIAGHSRNIFILIICINSIQKGLWDTKIMGAVFHVNLYFGGASVPKTEPL